MVYRNNGSNNGSNEAPNANEGAPENVDGDPSSESESESEEESVNLLESETDTQRRSEERAMARLAVLQQQLQLHGRRLSSQRAQFDRETQAHGRTRTSLTTQNTLLISQKEKLTTKIRENDARFKATIQQLRSENEANKLELLEKELTKRRTMMVSKSSTKLKITTKMTRDAPTTMPPVSLVHLVFLQDGFL